MSKKDKKKSGWVEFKGEVTLSDDPYYVAAPMQLLLKRHNKLGEKLVYFWVYGVDSSLVFGCTHIVAMSPISEPDIEPMDVFSFVKSKGLEGIVLITNHLDESIEPTAWDKQTAKRLTYASKIMKIPILDYLVINEGSYYSFKASGLLEEIEQEVSKDFKL